MKRVELEREIPPSFGDSMADGFLGNPEVVTGLVAAYCAKFQDALFRKEQGDLSPSEFLVVMDQLVHENSDIFSGRIDTYKVIPGYHDGTLPQKLKADLGAFWSAHRAAWGDDPVCVLFEWLAMMLADKMKLAGGDELLVQASFQPSMQYAIKVLLGIEDRQQ